MSHIDMIEADDLPLFEYKTTIVKMIDILKFQGQYVDVCVIVFDVGRVQTLTCLTNRTEKKQVITVVDQSKTLVCVEMWSTHAGKVIEEITGCSIKGRNLKVCQYREKTYLKTVDSTVLDLDPSMTDQTVSSLQQWWKKDGKNEDFEELGSQINDV